MVDYNVYGGRALRIAVGIMMLVLLLAGGVGAENSYDFCSSGEVLAVAMVSSVIHWSRCG